MSDTYICYVLESESTGGLYIGQTNDINDRLRRQNTGMNKYTRGRGPWRIIFTESFATRSGAMALEQKLKSFKNPQKVRDWIRHRLERPD